MNFKSFAEAWGWNYELYDKKWSQPEWDGLKLVELIPDKDATAQFWERYDQIWKM